MTAKHSRISFLFGLCWLIGFVAFTSFTPRHDSGIEFSGTETVLNQDLAQQVDSRISSELPKTPPFKVDWSLIHRLNTPWVSEELELNSALFAPSFFQKSISLFNVWETFCHFFHTW
jgi:hypothetical protein